jgi:PEP-CTERM motif
VKKVLVIAALLVGSLGVAASSAKADSISADQKSAISADAKFDSFRTSNEVIVNPSQIGFHRFRDFFWRFEDSDPSTPSTPTGGTTPAPEPATILLFGMGLVCLGLRRSVKFQR